MTTSSPTDSADSTMPQPRSPMVSLASTGPRVNQAPAWIALSTANATTTTHSQVVPVKIDQPSRSSVSIDSWASSRSRGRAGIRTRDRKATTSSHIVASTASAQPGPTVTTRTPASVGPTTASAPRDIDSSTLADCSCARGTNWGTTPDIAGKLTALTAPLTTSSAMTIHSSAASVITSVATVAWLRKDAIAENRINRARSNRSDSTPPNSRNTTIGVVLAASTRPRALAESLISSTANASATETIIDPVSEAKRAA